MGSGTRGRAPLGPPDLRRGPRNNRDHPAPGACTGSGSVITVVARSPDSSSSGHEQRISDVLTGSDWFHWFPSRSVPRLVPSSSSFPPSRVPICSILNHVVQELPGPATCLLKKTSGWQQPDPFLTGGREGGVGLMAPRASRQTPLADGAAGPQRSRALAPANTAPNPDVNPDPNPVEPRAHHQGTPHSLHFEPRGSRAARSRRCRDSCRARRVAAFTVTGV
jgi:hypothetical protein